MEIIKSVEDRKLTIELSGRLDATTSLELDKELQSSLYGIKQLVFDLGKLEYIATAGLRIFLKYHKLTDADDCTMIIRNVRSEVSEVFNMSGFSDFLNIVERPVKKLSIEF